MNDSVTSSGSRRWGEALRCAAALGLAVMMVNHAAMAQEKDQPKPSGVLEVTIVDSATGKPTPARAWVDAGDHRLFEPDGPDSCTPYERDRSFSCDGQFTMNLLAGDVIVHIERGKEYLPIDQRITVVANQTTKVTIEIHRWVHMAAEGWYSTDQHVHFGADDLKVLRQIALADDVNLVPAFSYWHHTNKFKRANWPEWPTDWPEWPEGETILVDDDHAISRANMEIERIIGGGERFHALGAPLFFNLEQPVAVEHYSENYPPDVVLLQRAKAVSPLCIIDTDKPTWAENVIGAAFGLFDTAQLCHNHYHRARSMPAGWGMAGILDESERDLSAEDELFVRTNAVYYRWLNCGIRLSAAGGSAMGVMGVPLGYNRTYAKIDGPFTPESFWDAVRSGRTFATSGPMLTIHVDGRDMGTTLLLESNDDRQLVVDVHLRSIDRIETLELVQNGRVVESITPPFGEGAALDYRKSWSIAPKRSGWVAARAIFRAPDGRMRQAHTSPVYFLIGAKPIAFKADAQYMQRWIVKLLEVSREEGRYESEDDLSHVQQLFLEAAAVYEQVEKLAERTWGD